MHDNLVTMVDRTVPLLVNLFPPRICFAVLALSVIDVCQAVAGVALEGRVSKAEGGAPLPYANLVIKGTFNSAIADDDGNFSIQVQSTPVILIVSYIGFERIEVEVADQSFIEVALNRIGLDGDAVALASRFEPRTAITSPVPLDIIGIDDLSATGHISFDKMLTYSVPAFNSSQQTVSDATAHFDPADLRGLGPGRTLVLINGKRKNPSSLVYINDTPSKGEVGVDMKSVPAAAIERVEIMRDGASAQYGSDAIAGVINVVLKDEAEGTDIRVSSGTTGKGDGDFRHYNLSTGFKIGDDGFVNVAHSFTDQDETDRAASPGADGLFDADSDDDWVQQNPDLGMTIGQPRLAISDIFFNAQLPMKDDVEFYSFGGRQYRNGRSFALYRTPYWIPDPHNIFHDDGDPYEGFQPTLDADILDDTIVVGARGRRQGWHFDLSQTSGSNSANYTVHNSLNTDLGPESPTTFRVGGYDFGHRVTDFDLARRIHYANVSMGTEFRTERFRSSAGEEASYVGSGTQSFPGIQPQNEIDVHRYNMGLYAGLSVDIGEDWLVDVASRLETYSDFGNTITWKMSGRRRIIRGTGSVRASASTGFRAPSLHQIYLSNIQTLVSGGTVSNQGTFDNESAVLRTLGVPQLEEEQALNFTAGVALQPSSRLFLSFDAYQVEVNDRIVYSSSITSSDTTSALGRILDLHDITSLKFFANAVDTRTRGIDIVASFATVTGRVTTIDVDLAAHIVDTDIVGEIATPPSIAAAGSEIFDRKEQSRILTARPRSKILLRLSYERRALRAELNNTRFGTVGWQHATDPDKDQEFDARIVTDLNLAYRLSKIISVGVTVNNLFNVYPEKIDAGGDVLTDLGGRFQYPWEVNQFGFNGITFSSGIHVQF